VEVPETRYALTSDGLHIAYQVWGDGPIDLLLVPGFISHVEMAWEWPPLSSVLSRLGSFARVIGFDKRGTGLSDRMGDLPDADRRMLDLSAVMQAAGSERAVLLGISEGGSLAILFAATYPHRTEALIVCGSYAYPIRTDNHPLGVTADELARMAEYLSSRWGTGVGLRAWAPSVGEDQEARRWWGRLQRMAASPGAARLLVDSYNRIDVRPALPLVRVPTLVLHSKGDRMVPVALGREIADGITGSTLVEMEGADHLVTAVNGPVIVDTVAEFLPGVAELPTPDRILATVLFTDIVGSTQRLSEVGDLRWREVLDAHDQMVERHVARYGGRFVTGTGDGALAVFDGPTRAIRCAEAVRDGARSLGLRVRAGLHTGELVVRNGDVAGIAVHLAQRVSALAGPDEVLISRTLADLVAGSGLVFEDRGEHELKGVDGRWRLYAVSA
jgi:class 3 adenylate cyclase